MEPLTVAAKFHCGQCRCCASILANKQPRWLVFTLKCNFLSPHGTFTETSLHRHLQPPSSRSLRGFVAAAAAHHAFAAAQSGDGKLPPLTRYRSRFTWLFGPAAPPPPPTTMRLEPLFWTEWLLHTQTESLKQQQQRQKLGLSAAPPEGADLTAVGVSSRPRCSH